MLSEKERADIVKEAQRVLDNFGKSLKDVKIEKKKKVDRVAGFREEGEGLKVNSDFRKIMFENAPQKEGDFIIAESKEW